MFAKSGLFSSRPSPPKAGVGCGLWAAGGLEVPAWHGAVWEDLRAMLAERGGENSPAINPQSCTKCGAGKNFTRTGFIGKVACTSLVFNFQFSFNCSFLGGFRDSCNSFQLAPHGANPVAPLPHRCSLELRQISGVRKRKAPAAEGNLTRPLGHYLELLKKSLMSNWECSLLHTTVHTSGAEVKALNQKII